MEGYVALANALDALRDSRELELPRLLASAAGPGHMKPLDGRMGLTLHETLTAPLP